MVEREADQIAEPAAGRDIRPVVARPRTGLSTAAIIAIGTLIGLVFFLVLDGRRRGLSAPVTFAARSDLARPRALPPLNLPPLAAEAPEVEPDWQPSPMIDQPTDFAAPAIPQAQPTYFPPPAIAQDELIAPLATRAPAATRAPRSIGGQTLVSDSSGGVPQVEATEGEAEDGDERGARARLSTVRARAAMLANRTTTVPQGTLIPAVLETAFDSTSPGFARALVQRDVHGFDGTRVLIPRGSRLVGEYGADTQQGQRRAVILWSRLIRPDGVTIAIGSPAADTVGRGGVRANVDTHFLERFSGAILQSVLDFGVTLAARSSGAPVILALPGSIGGTAAAGRGRGSDIAPTLRVPAGRSVGVFVARDLDFTGADTAR